MSEPEVNVLEGLLINLDSRTVDVDEDGPYMQIGVPIWGGRKFYTQYSVFRETIITYYSASMVKADDPDDCHAVQLKLDNGSLSTDYYKPLTTAIGLGYLDNMRSKKTREYAPPGVCTAMVQKQPVLGWDPNSNEPEIIFTEWVPIPGKESNYSLSNLIPRSDFWTEELDLQNGTIGLTIPCGDKLDVTQGSGSGDFRIGGVWVPSPDAAWNGMLTNSIPRIDSFRPRFSHMSYDAASHTLSWQEERYNSYILFNNFAPDGAGEVGPLNVPYFGAGGYWFQLPVYRVPIDDDDYPEDEIPWSRQP